MEIVFGQGSFDVSIPMKELANIWIRKGYPLATLMDAGKNGIADQDTMTALQDICQIACDQVYQVAEEKGLKDRMGFMDNMEDVAFAVYVNTGGMYIRASLREDVQMIQQPQQLQQLQQLRQGQVPDTAKKLEQAMNIASKAGTQGQEQKQEQKQGQGQGQKGKSAPAKKVMRDKSARGEASRLKDRADSETTALLEQMRGYLDNTPAPTYSELEEMLFNSSYWKYIMELCKDDPDRIKYITEQQKEMVRQQIRCHELVERAIYRMDGILEATDMVSIIKAGALITVGGGYYLVSEKEIPALGEFGRRTRMTGYPDSAVISYIKDGKMIGTERPRVSLI